MENYSNNKIFKFLAEKSSTLTIIFVGIVAVGICLLLVLENIYWGV